MKTPVVAALLVAAACHAPMLAQDVQGGKIWAVPTCAVISGTDAVTYTKDEGATLTPTQGVLRGTSYTAGLVALDKANTLLAVQQRRLLRSATSGCKWASLGTLASVSDGAPVILAKSVDDRAYGWSDGRNDLLRIDGRKVTYLTSPTASLVGLAADRTAGDRVRIGGGDGQLHESIDAGVSWRRIGTPPIAGGSGLYYRTAFDPADLDHAVTGTVREGAFVTFDGGATWTKASGLSSIGSGPVNVFSAVVSPASPAVVWVMGLDLAEADAGAPSGGRHIYRSTDGGRTFSPVVDQRPGIVLPNGPVMAAHPTNAGVVYFVFGTSVSQYGTDIYRYDASDGTVTTTHNTYDRVSALAFNPADAGTMYLGLSVESGF